METIDIIQVERGNATIEGVFRNWIIPSFWVWCSILLLLVAFPEAFQLVFEIGGTALICVSALFGFVYIMGNS